MKICGTVVRPLARAVIVAAQLAIAADVDLGEGRRSSCAAAPWPNGNRGSTGWCRFRRGAWLIVVGARHAGATIIWERARASTTRANTSTSTLPAPARSSARAQASEVAPEVSTSSTSTSRRPATSALRSAGTRKAPCTLRARSACDRPTCCAVALTRLSAVVGDGDAGLLRDRLGQQRRLVEAARPQPPPMQRHRHQRIGLVQQFAAGARHPAAHGGREIEPVAVFQRMHQRARDLVVAHRGARPVVGRRVGDRLHRQHARAGIVGERNAEPLAIGRRDERELRPAGRAQAVAADRLAAGRAERRQRDIERAPENRAKWRRHAGQPRRVYGLCNRFLHGLEAIAVMTSPQQRPRLVNAATRRLAATGEARYARMGFARDRHATARHGAQIVGLILLALMAGACGVRGLPAAQGRLARMARYRRLPVAQPVFRDRLRRRAGAAGRRRGRRPTATACASRHLHGRGRAGERRAAACERDLDAPKDSQARQQDRRQSQADAPIARKIPSCGKS